ncbi:uncharacterized mitochondrial protein AtMg00810-like [Lycium barbarum]|uniref:uncharacterized mitochondrial protein AtMg00810-like n=1 Tax=Lycium barbarum TaxID=112863 RepID=UPI00293E7095|nr:uncharacterized mitochondrial protein AtMg00810-like [Lycium barbarum]
MGFQQSHYDYLLFTKKTNTDIVVVPVYVDDLLITGNNPRLLSDTRKDLQKKFKMKDLGELKFFLGIECAKSSKGIVLSQKKYALELIAESGLGGAKPSGTPLEMNQKLTSSMYDQCIPKESNTKENIIEDQILPDPSSYQRLVGRLLYLTMTRPDFSFAVQVLSQYMHFTKVSHMETALRVVRYIKEAPGLGLLMLAEKTRRSVTRYLVKFGGALVSWKSKKQETVSKSSAEAEFKSMATCAAEITWLLGLFRELGTQVNVPISMRKDMSRNAEN